MTVVSIIIPVFNSASTIAETVESAVNQTFPDIEIIIVNDGSTDETLTVLSQFDDPRIRVFSYENGGSSQARNHGIKKATGEFITFIDADDLWSPDKIELQVKTLRHNPDAGVAYSWTTFMDEAGCVLYHQTPAYDEGDIYPALLVRNFMCSGSNILARRSVIEAVGEFDTQLSSVVDWEYYLRLAAHCRFALVRKHQIFYRKSSQSISGNLPQVEVNSIAVINRAFQQAPQHLQSLKHQSLSELYYYLARQYIRYDHCRANVVLALQKMRQAVRERPQLLLKRPVQKLFAKLLLLRVIPQSKTDSLPNNSWQHQPAESTQQQPAAPSTKAI